MAHKVSGGAEGPLATRIGQALPPEETPHVVFERLTQDRARCYFKDSTFRAPAMPKRPQDRRPAETIKFSSEDVQDFSHIARRFGSLVVVQGAETDLGTHVVCDRPVTLGRDSDVELPLRDGSISRRHCCIERDDQSGRYVLRDLGSTNGTRVNGTRVVEPVSLAEGDKIFLGATVAKFSYADSVDVEFQAKLESMVNEDALTGLLSQRKFDNAYALAVQAAREAGGTLSVLVMDMDGLKIINDTHGHQMGGFTIIEVARIIQTVVATRGETCRFGGDEFMTYLPAYDKATACQLADKLRDTVCHHRFEKDGVQVRPTISIGVATLPDDGDKPDDLFNAADRALYRAKSAGKNQVAV
jgi:diguanylate cyclase (GGDEF)-like protein